VRRVCEGSQRSDERIGDEGSHYRVVFIPDRFSCGSTLAQTKVLGVTTVATPSTARAVVKGQAEPST
jgi:hypothetical protein